MRLKEKGTQSIKEFYMYSCRMHSKWKNIDAVVKCLDSIHGLQPGEIPLSIIFYGLHWKGLKCFMKVKCKWLYAIWSLGYK